MTEPANKSSLDNLGLDQLGSALELCFKLFRYLFFICLVGFLLSGVHTVPQGKVAYVQRWGAWIEEAETPGIHLSYPPFVDKVIYFDLQEQRTLELDNFDAPEAGRGTMSDKALLTGDGQIIHTRWVLTYTVKNPIDIWNLLGHDFEDKLEPYLSKLLSSLVISECSNSTIDELLSQHQKLQQSVFDRFTIHLQDMNSGLEIIDLNLIGPRVPPSTVDSFENVQRQLLYNENIRGEANFFAQNLYRKIDVSKSQFIGRAKAQAKAITQQLKGEALAINTLLKKYDKKTREAYLEQKIQTALQNAMANNSEQIYVLQPGGERRIQLGADPELRRALQKSKKERK